MFGSTIAKKTVLENDNVYFFCKPTYLHPIAMGGSTTTKHWINTVLVLKTKMSRQSNRNVEPP